MLFGASDDLVEMAGRISKDKGHCNDEVGAFEGCELFFTPDGYLRITEPNPDWTWAYDEEEIREYVVNELKYKLNSSVKSGDIRRVDCLWYPGDNISWAYETEIPHETFRIMEDSKVYCRGIVFALEDIKDAAC